MGTDFEMSNFVYLILQAKCENPRSEAFGKYLQWKILVQLF